ncbi:uncharacterized protein LOC132204040 [Neocloeon triangulifer]|uniref:uncharacterized protein LOC132204040 n=1 Tax=Neocloeon triangulifer TaxID=2078957 RepID=UPI00286F8391|nr:uncharacterized protein LOC132204040 [Neocloeon triangulifer]
MTITAETLEKLCLRFIVKFHKEITDYSVVAQNKSPMNLQGLPASVKEKFFEASRESGQASALPYWFAMALIGSNTQHVNLKGVETFSAVDLALDLRSKGVHRLSSLVLDHWPGAVVDPIRPQQLVPNASLVRVCMRQMFCGTHDLATVAFKFPQIRELTVTVSGDCSFGHLAKMEHLREFFFFYESSNDDERGSDGVRRADVLLYSLLWSVPRLHRAGRVKSTGHELCVQDMSEGLRLLKPPLGLTFAKVSASKVASLQLAHLLPNLAELELHLDSIVPDVQDFLIFPKLKSFHLWSHLGIAKEDRQFFVKTLQDHYQGLRVQNAFA